MQLGIFIINRLTMPSFRSLFRGSLCVMKFFQVMGALVTYEQGPKRGTEMRGGCILMVEGNF